MNETKLFLDTNAIIALLKGHAQLPQILAGANWIGTSAICVIEFFSYSLSSLAYTLLFNDFIKTIEIAGVTNNAVLLQNEASIKNSTASNFRMPLLQAGQLLLVQAWYQAIVILKTNLI